MKSIHIKTDELTDVYDQNTHSRRIYVKQKPFFFSLPLTGIDFKFLWLYQERKKNQKQTPFVSVETVTVNSIGRVMIIRAGEGERVPP